MKHLPSPEKMISLEFEADPELLGFCNRLADDKGIAFEDLVREAVRAYVEKKGGG